MSHKPRARDLGIPFNGNPGQFNAITDVPGVEVGHATVIRGDPQQNTGIRVSRTGVTAILPRGRRYDPAFAAWFSLNGCGEMTGTSWIEESGFLESGIALTNTASVGNVYNATIRWATHHLEIDFAKVRDVFWFLPVVGETNDMLLNDLLGSQVQESQVFAAFDAASPGPVDEGNVGGGTGMVCHDFKGGIGTASRKLSHEEGGYTVGILVQANYGYRQDLTIAGIPIGLEIPDLMPEIHDFRFSQEAKSSIIVIVATDAPLLPNQLKRMAKRAPLGLAKTGGIGGNSSGDLFLAFSTANTSSPGSNGFGRAEYLMNAQMNPLFRAAIEATEEAIVNALVAAETMIGVNGNKVHALPHDRLVEILRKYHRLNNPSN